jgi:hypothetical protein
MRRKRAVAKRRGKPRKGTTNRTIVDALTDAEIEAAVRDDPDAVPLDFDWSDAAPVMPPKKKRKRKQRT